MKKLKLFYGNQWMNSTGNKSFQAINPCNGEVIAELLSGTTELLQAVIQMTIAIVVSGLIFYFLVRSSLTSRVKEISILRSLGVSKYEVLSLFTVEYFILTLFTSFIGVILGSILTNSLYNSFMGAMLGVRVTPVSLLISIVGIFLTNIILALIPLLLLLRKTPANMLTMYDI